MDIEAVPVIGSLLVVALFAGAVAIFVTVAIERWGGRVGGIVGTIPSTIVPAAIGIFAESASIEAFTVAMCITPVGMLINGVFLALWRWVPPRIGVTGLYRRLGLTLSVTMAVWMGLALAAVMCTSWARRAGLAMWAIGAGATALHVLIGVVATRYTHPAPRGSRRVGPLTLLLRGLLAGVAIAVSVWLAHIGGPLAAGVAAVFPAIFLTTMCALWISQGEVVQGGAVGPMMLGATSVSGFAMGAAWTIPSYGPALGASIAWIFAAVVFTGPAWFWLERRAVWVPVRPAGE